METSTITKVAHLQPNILYCDSPEILQSISQMQTSTDGRVLHLPPEIVARLTEHTLTFRLLHYYGPFQRPTRQLVLLACCLHDDSANVLLTKQLSPGEETKNNGSFDDYINSTFTLKNFMVLPLKAVTFNCGQLNCPIGNRPLHNFVIVASSEFHSTMHFFDNTLDLDADDDGDVSFKSALEELPTDPPVDGELREDGEEDDASELSDISLSDLPPNVLLSLESSLAPEEVSRLSTTTAATSPTTSLRRMDINTASSPSPSRKRKLPDSDWIVTVFDQANEARIIDSVTGSGRHLDASTPQIHSTSISRSPTLPPLQAEMLCDLPQDSKENPTVKSFISTHFHRVDDTSRSVTTLSALSNARTRTPNYHFANVVGIVHDTFTRVERKLIIWDEETTNFTLSLGYCGLDRVRANPRQTESSKQVIFENARLITYPKMTKGDLVCIRDLCLGTGSFQVCLHPEQLVVLQPFRENAFASHGGTVSKEEFKRILELTIKLATSLVQSPSTYRVLNYYIIDLCGQVVGKQLSGQSGTLEMKLYLLLPFQTTMRTHLVESSRYLADCIAQSALPNRGTLSQSLLDRLISENHIVMVILYGRHAQEATEMDYFSLVYLTNVHITKDKFYPGLYRFIIHERNDFRCRGCFAVDYNSIPGNTVLRTIDVNIDALTAPVPPPVLPNVLVLDEEEEEAWAEDILSQQMITRRDDADEVIVERLVKGAGQHFAELYSEDDSG